jgi:hypothetical protein
MIEKIEEVLNFEVAIELLDYTLEDIIEEKVTETTAANVTGSNVEEAIVTEDDERDQTKARRQQRPLCDERRNDRKRFDLHEREDPDNHSS